MSPDSALARLLSNHGADWSVVVDQHGKVLATSPGADAFGYSEEFWSGSTVFDVVPETHRDVARGTFGQVLDQPDLVLRGECPVRNAVGHTEVIEAELHNRLADPELRGLVVIARPATEQRLTRRLISAQSEVLGMVARGDAVERTLNAVADLLHEQFEAHGVLLLRLEASRVTPVAVRGMPPGLLAAVDGAMVPRIEDEPAPYLRRLLTGPFDGAGAGPVPTSEHPDHHARFLEDHGVSACWALPFPAESGQPEGAVVLFLTEDRPPTGRERQAMALASRTGTVALARHRLDTRRAWESTHDALTGLLNRSALEATMRSLLRREGRHVSVLFVDLDQFKLVNDAFGHDAGDLLLQQAAHRMSSLLEPEDTLARFGGDSFVVLLHSRLPTNEAEVVAERITTALGEPFLLPDTPTTLADGATGALDRSDGGAAGSPADRRPEVYLTASVGLATTSAGPYSSVPALLANADAALAEAKRMGRGQVASFQERMKRQVVARLESENRLRKALLQREFVLHYQPVVDLATGAVTGAEALIRWQPPGADPILPAQFISVAEETGLIVPMGAWAVHTGVGQARQWAAVTGRTDLTMAVNMSAVQVGDPSFPDVVADALARHDWPPSQLVLELTETGLAQTKVAGREALARLADLGVGLAVDDFGTGYSSLGSLHQLPVSTVKIDRSFIVTIEGDGEPIVRAALQIADALGLHAIAEGIETEAQREATRRLGCPSGQGFLFARPVPAAEFLALLG